MLNPSTLNFVRHFVRRYPARTLLLVFLLVLSGLSEGVGVVALLPLLELSGISGASQPSEVSIFLQGLLATLGVPPRLEILLGVIVLAMALKGGFRLLAMKQVGYTVAHVATDLRLTLIRALLRTRWSHYKNQPTGQFANALAAEANRASGGYQAAVNMFAAAIQALIYAAIAFWVSWSIALVAVVGGGVAVLALSRLVELSRSAAKTQAVLMRSLVGRFTDALQGIKPIKAMGREEHLQPLLETETHAINRAQEKQVIASEAVTASQEPILVLMMALVLYVALTYGDQSFGAVLVMGFLFYRLAGRIGVVQLSYQNITGGEGFFWSIQESITAAEAEEEPRTGDLEPRLEKGIVLDSVDFDYAGEPVLRKGSMEIPVRTFVALVGPSGAGKTTVADLIVRLYEPKGGEIRVDGVPLNEINLVAWRRAIGYVPQEMFLFHDTVFNNVSLGDPSITRDDVRAALRAAGAWDFIEALPEVMDTVLGERGSRISGGQRQRVAIARALASRPALLVLDEVTTALDPKTEASICETLAELAKSVTILSISHQPAMMAAAEIVYRLEDGRLKRREVPTGVGI